MRLVFCAGLVLAASSFAQDQGRLSDSQQAYTDFLATTPGQWVAQWHPGTLTPSAIYGNGLALENWTENSLEHARVHANRVLTDYRDLLGLGTSQWRESIGARMGRTWSFKFDQHFNGLPVIGGRADVRVNMKGVIAMMGSVAFPVPANFVTVPQITEQLANAIAWQKIGESTGVAQPGVPRQPRLVIWGDTETDGAPFDLAWEIPISNVDLNGQGPIGRYYIDARIGAVLHYKTDKHDCHSPFCASPHHGINRAKDNGPIAPLPAPVPTIVTIMAWTRTGDDAQSALVNTPLRGLVVNVSGLGQRTTSASGQIVIDIGAPTTVSATGLNGTHHQLISGSSAPSINQVINPGVNATIQIGSSASNEFAAAHPTTSYWVTRSNEWCRGILGNSSEMNTISSILPRVNIGNNCNAYYTSNTINFYTSGGGCANTAFSTVIAHEWGHGLDQRYGGISNSNAEGLSEGWGDIIGMYQVDSPILGSGFSTPGVGIRNGNNNRLYPYSSSSPHGAGQVWMGFAWRLRDYLRASYGTQTAIDISEDIVISSIVADATNRVDAVREVFIADDDDGNLLNGTPNYNELEAAALAKNLPYPVVQVATITHAPLGNTSKLATSRKVTCNAAVVSSGTLTSVTLHYSTNGGATQVRNLHPNGNLNGYEAMLPGLLSNGTVTYRIEAVHNGTFTVRSPTTGNYTYIVDETTFWSDNFDGTPQGWTSAQVATQNDWQVGDPAGKSGTSSGVFWADPQVAASGPNCYGNDLGNTIGGQAWNGRYQPNVYNYLRSPPIDCTGRSSVELSFSRWLTVEEGIYDRATLLVNGVQIWQNQQNGHHRDTSWQSVSYPIPVANNNPSVVIEFRLQTDGGLHLGGWNIDDIQLKDLGAQPLYSTLQMLPEQAVQNSAINLAVTTSGASRPFVLVIGDTAGPTLFPGVPPILVGGSTVNLPAWTDAAGNFNWAFNAPSVATAVGATWYSQVVTLDPTNTMIVTSNEFLNLFTMTP